MSLSAIAAHFIAPPAPVAPTSAAQAPVQATQKPDNSTSAIPQTPVGSTTSAVDKLV
jgi:hypothetical protein